MARCLPYIILSDDSCTDVPSSIASSRPLIHQPRCPACLCYGKDCPHLAPRCTQKSSQTLIPSLRTSKQETYERDNEYDSDASSHMLRPRRIRPPGWPHQYGLLEEQAISDQGSTTHAPIVRTQRPAIYPPEPTRNGNQTFPTMVPEATSRSTPSPQEETCTFPNQGLPIADDCALLLPQLPNRVIPATVACSSIGRCLLCQQFTPDQSSIVLKTTHLSPSAHTARYLLPPASTPTTDCNSRPHFDSNCRDAPSLSGFAIRWTPSLTGGGWLSESEELSSWSSQSSLHPE